MNGLEVHIVERTSKKKYKNVEVYNLQEFQTASYSVVKRALNDVGVLGRLLPGFANKLKVRIAVQFQRLFEARLKENRNR